MRYTNFICAIVFSAFVRFALGQSGNEMTKRHLIDSIKMEALSSYAMRYPIIRQGMLSADFMGNRTVSGKLNGKTLYREKLNISRIRSMFNIPISQWGKNTVTGTVAYQQLHYSAGDVRIIDPSYTVANGTFTKRTIGFTGTLSHSDSLFGLPVNLSAGISGLTDDATSIKRINYTGSANISIRRTSVYSLSVGFAVILDPSSVAPFIPFVSYWRKLQGMDMDLFVDLPYRIALRKQFSKRNWIFLGSELGGNLYFFDLDQVPLPQNDIYTTIDIRTGATLEHLFGKKLVLGLSGGLYTTAQNRMYEHKAKSDRYFFKMSNGTVPYLNVSLSLLPFLKRH